MDKFRVHARCDNPRCRVSNFVSGRKKGTYTSTDGHEHPIARIVCPECRTWGEVVQVEEVAA